MHRVPKLGPPGGADVRVIAKILADAGKLEPDYDARGT